MKKVKHPNVPKGDRKRLTVRLSKATWRSTATAARGAGMTVNDLIGAVLKWWNGRTPPVSK